MGELSRGMGELSIRSESETADELSADELTADTGEEALKRADELTERAEEAVKRLNFDEAVDCFEKVLRIRVLAIKTGSADQISESVRPVNAILEKWLEAIKLWSSTEAAGA